jgi:hypothetical protein
MSHSRLFTYFQSTCRSIAIAGCYITVSSSHAQAQLRSIDPSNRDLVKPGAAQTVGVVSLSKQCGKLRFGSSSATAVIQPQICNDNSGQDLKAQSKDVKVDRVAQVIPVSAIPFALPIQISPAFLTPIPPSNPLVPLNSILTPTLLAPNKTPAVPLINAPTAPKPASIQDPQFIIPPRELEPRQVDPFSTQFILNGNKISHLTPTVVRTGYESGNFRTSDLNFDVYKLIKADNIQSVTKDSVVRVNSSIELVGVRSVLQNREITTTTSQPQTLLGVRQQISLDASCQDRSEQTCTYLPGVKIDESTIDPRTLQPNGVKITSQYGDVISPTSLAAIRTPGFQGGIAGENFGIDLYLPAIGSVATPWSRNSPSMGVRQEKIDTAVAVNFTRMNQNFATNGVESVLGRTIRSLNYINNDRNQLVNAAIQALGQILPEFQPSIAPGQPGARIVVNPNLYRVANAIGIPENSQTVYQSGTGSAVSIGKDPTLLPGASYQAIWLGLSPVIDRQVTRDYYYVTRRNPQIVSSSGGESRDLPVAVNLNDFGFDSGSLKNPYSQGYVTVYNRDVDRYDLETLRQRTDYVPHLRLTGATLNENSLWRYYTGAIASIGSQSTPNNIKAYVGTDYSIANRQGLSIGLGGIGYLNADPEYTSQLFANVSQSLRLGPNPRHRLVIGANANYIIDGTVTIQSLPMRSTQSFVNVGMTLDLGNISVGGTQFIGNLLPESTASKTIFNVGWKVTDRLNLGAFYTAADRNITSNPYGASLSLALDANSNSTLYLGWNAAEIDFRRTLGTKANVYRDNTFSLSVRYGF